jgi:hypothetical protein
MAVPCHSPISVGSERGAVMTFCHRSDITHLRMSLLGDPALEGAFRLPSGSS